MNPMPPCRAMAIASRESVTVSMAAATTGIFSAILRETQVRVSTCAGRIEDFPGRSSTSSNVSPSGIAPSIIISPVRPIGLQKHESPAEFAELGKAFRVEEDRHESIQNSRRIAGRKQGTGQTDFKRISN